MSKLAPSEQLKDIYWVAHFFFFIIILIQDIVEKPQQATLGLVSYEYVFSFILAFSFFLVINSIFLKAIGEKFSAQGNIRYQILYTLSLTLFTIIFTMLSGEKVNNWVYVFPITLVSLTCGFKLGLTSLIIFSINIFWFDRAISYQNLPIILCLLLLAWLVGQIAEVNFRQALQLERERLFLADLIDTFSGGIIISNLEGEVVLCNREVKNIFNLSEKEIIRKGESLLWVSSSVPFHKWMPNFINMEVSIGPREYLVNRFAITGTEPGKKCYVTVINDITELQQQKSRIQNLSTLSAVGELAAGAAHEIKNPLTTIRGFIQLIAEKMPDNRLSGLCSLSIEELDRITQIINSMLQLAKPERKEFQNLNLSEIVKETWDLYTYSIVRKGINVENNLVDELPIIIGSNKQIKQVLLNLIQNAERACSPGDRITLKTFFDSSWVCLEVSDTGKGISPEHMDKLFSPFFTTDFTGTGIGLAICNRIISDHNGRIQVKSELGVGTSFLLSFIPYTE